MQLIGPPPVLGGVETCTSFEAYGDACHRTRDFPQNSLCLFLQPLAACVRPYRRLRPLPALGIEQHKVFDRPIMLRPFMLVTSSATELRARAEPTRVSM